MKVIDAFLDAEVADVLEEDGLTGLGHEGLEEENDDITDDEPLGDGGPLERAGHGGRALSVAAALCLHVVSIVISHGEEVAVNAES